MHLSRVSLHVFALELVYDSSLYLQNFHLLLQMLSHRHETTFIYRNSQLSSLRSKKRKKSKMRKMTNIYLYTV